MAELCAGYEGRGRFGPADHDALRLVFRETCNALTEAVSASASDAA